MSWNFKKKKKPKATKSYSSVVKVAWQFLSGIGSLTLPLPPVDFSEF